MLNIFFRPHAPYQIFFLKSFFIITHSFDYPVLFFLEAITLHDLLFASSQVFILYFSQDNCLRNQIVTYLIQFPWQYGFNTLQFIILAPLIPFATHRLAMPLFPVFCDLLSSNDIGFHTIGLLLTFNSWF